MQNFLQSISLRYNIKFLLFFELVSDHIFSLNLLPKLNVGDLNKYGLYSGDVDRSGFVVVSDITAVRAVFNTILADFNYLTRSADVDMNGFIVVTDINLIRANFNRIQVNLGQ